jgi:hypothetical protein
MADTILHTTVNEFQHKICSLIETFYKPELIFHPKEAYYTYI